ncbi:MAG: hypothetical protein GY944_10960 [bacterium]|nr:hypothetical protein [bacterium]
MRCFQFLAGVCWIGMLWYFNLIQTPFFGSELGGHAKSAMTRGLMPALTLVLYIVGAVLNEDPAGAKQWGPRVFSLRTPQSRPRCSKTWRRKLTGMLPALR